MRTIGVLTSPDRKLMLERVSHDKRSEHRQVAPLVVQITQFRSAPRSLHLERMGDAYVSWRFNAHTGTGHRADGIRRLRRQPLRRLRRGQHRHPNRGDDTSGGSICSPLFYFLVSEGRCCPASKPIISLSYISLFGFQRLKGIVHD